MKKPLFLLISILYFTLLSAQKFAVAPDKNNIFYLGVDNPITIAVENYSCESLIIKSDNGNVSGKLCSYLYRGARVGKAEIIIFAKKKGRLVELGRSSFRVKNLPDPIAKVGPSARGSIKKLVLMSQQFIRGELEDFDINIKYPIDSFTLSILNQDNGLFKEIISREGNQFSIEVVNALKTIKAGDTVIFKDIYSRRTDGSSFNLHPIILKVTD